MGYYAIGYKTTLEYDAMAICHDMLKLFSSLVQGMKATTRLLCPGGFETAAAASPACRTHMSHTSLLGRLLQISQSNFSVQKKMNGPLFVGFDIYRMLMNDPLWKRMKRSCPSFRRTLPASLEDSAIATPQQPRTKSTYVCHGYAKQSTTPYMSWQEAWQYIISESNRK